MTKEDWRRGTIYEGKDYVDPVPLFELVNVGTKKVPIIKYRRID